MLLHYYRLYGEDCSEYFEGMWSFAIFDGDRQPCSCRGTDFAEKPLYLLCMAHGMYFGSEMKFLGALAVDVLRPNIEQVQPLSRARLQGAV